MSTRCQMGIYENENDKVRMIDVLLYRHSDGMPESVLPDIKPFLNEFNKVRGIDDKAYCLARLTQHLTNLHNKSINEIYDRMGRINSGMEKESLFLSYGIGTEFYADIEYFYHISPTAIKVYECDTLGADHWKVIKTVKLTAGRHIEVA